MAVRNRKKDAVYAAAVEFLEKQTDQGESKINELILRQARDVLHRVPGLATHFPHLPHATDLQARSSRCQCGLVKSGL